MCQWVSIRPGSTIMSVASITSAPGAFTSTPTATISPPRTWTEPRGRSPSAGSIVRTKPLRITKSPRGGNGPAARAPWPLCACARRRVGNAPMPPSAVSPRRKLRLHRSHMSYLPACCLPLSVALLRRESSPHSRDAALREDLTAIRPQCPTELFSPCHGRTARKLGQIRHVRLDRPHDVAAHDRHAVGRELLAEPAAAIDRSADEAVEMR